MGVEGKRLLVLGAGRGQIGLYKAAKEMGITTIAGTMPDNNPPGIPLADEVCFMNIANPDEVAKKAAKLKLDGVATCCLDTGISALGKTCDSLGLTGLPEKAAIMCNDKSKMKKAFMEYGVSTAQYFEISNEEELKNALDKIKLPVIIKATDLQGSNGIYIAKTEKDAYDGFHAAMKLTKRSYCIVEEFIEGWEFGAQAFVYNNEVLFVMPHGDETYMSHTAVPVGHYVPLDCDENIHKQTEEAVKNAIKALGLNNCAVNVGIILILPFLAVFVSAYNIWREGGNASSLNFFEGILNFFYDQGVTGNVLKRAYMYKNQIPKQIYTLEFLHSGILARLFNIKVYHGNTVDHAMYGGSFTHTLGYTVMNSAYLAGRGTGSSYIAELYQDFGYTGIILGNILYSFLLARITKNEDNDSLLKKSIKFMIITQLLWAPRGSFTYFISQNLTPTTIATLLLVFGISYLWEKRKYARKRKYS